MNVISIGELRKARYMLVTKTTLHVADYGTLYLPLSFVHELA